MFYRCYHHLWIGEARLWPVLPIGMLKLHYMLVGCLIICTEVSRKLCFSCINFFCYIVKIGNIVGVYTIYVIQCWKGNGIDYVKNLCLFAIHALLSIKTLFLKFGSCFILWKQSLLIFYLCVSLGPYPDHAVGILYTTLWTNMTVNVAIWVKWFNVRKQDYTVIFSWSSWVHLVNCRWAFSPSYP